MTSTFARRSCPAGKVVEETELEMHALAFRDGRLLDLHQLDDTPGYVPVLEVQVTVFVPVRAVRTAEDTLNPPFLRDIEVHPLLGIRVVAENRDDRVAFVKNDQSPVQIRYMIPGRPCIPFRTAAIIGTCFGPKTIRDISLRP